MQRVRMSLPYFADFGWDAEVVCVNPQFVDMAKDELLTESVPAGIKTHYVNAFSKSLTAKFGLGSIALRSLWFYRKEVNRLLKAQQFDLIYFSTTQFPICILGVYWKKRFDIPYVIDMQDPWHSDYYRDKPKYQRPPKYWFSYRLNKLLEPKAMKSVGGLISVSEDYITTLKQRYPEITAVPASTITFGAFAPDLKIAADNRQRFQSLLDSESKNIVYVGRGGNDMHKAITPLFAALKEGLANSPEVFGNLKLYFIGTSYAPAGLGTQTIIPLAKQYGVEQYVTELTDRISYYHTLLTLQQADALFIPGSDDPKYTASKIFPYLLTQKPLLAIFNKNSSAIGILQEFGAEHVYDYENVEQSALIDFMKQVATGNMATPTYNTAAEEKYSAKHMTSAQCQLFDKVLSGHSTAKNVPA